MPQAPPNMLFSKAVAAPAILTPLSTTKYMPPRKDSGVCLEKESHVDEDSLSELLTRLCVTPPHPVLGRRIPKVTFHFVRHAQALHNVRGVPRPGEMHDPALTQHGYAQCHHLKNVFPRMDKITHMFCSPMIRTFATALVGFDPVFDRGLKAIAWDDLREWGKSLCSTGTSLEILKEALEGCPVDFRLLSEGWEYNSEPDRFTRAARVRQDLYSLGQAVSQGGKWKGMEFEAYEGEGDVDILIVSHGGFLSSMLGYDRQIFHNAQWKSFKFASEKSIKEGAWKYDWVEKKASRRHYHIKVPEIVADPAS